MDGAVAIGVEPGDERRKGVRDEFIVGVEKHDVPGSNALECGVAGGAGALAPFQAHRLDRPEIRLTGTREALSTTISSAAVG